MIWLDTVDEEESGVEQLEGVADVEFLRQLEEEAGDEHQAEQIEIATIEQRLEEYLPAVQSLVERGGRPIRDRRRSGNLRDFL